MTQEALTLTQGALAARKLKPNLDKKNHIFKVFILAQSILTKSSLHPDALDVGDVRRDTH